MTLLYFAPVRWDDYPQRPHSFVRYFLEQPGRSVVWVDPYPSRFPLPRDLRRRGGPSLTPRPPNLEVVGPRFLPVEPLSAGRWLNRRLFHTRLLARLRSRLSQGPFGIGVGRPSDLALLALDTLKPVWSVYDAMDDFPEFYLGWSKRAVRLVERQIAARVDVMLVPSSALWEKFESQAARRVLIRNAFEMRSLPPPRRTASERPVFGYVGCVSGWFDWSTVVELARRVPHATVEIVGPRFTEPKAVPDNVRLLPACSHEDAVAHLQRFSAGLIPFKRNRLTDGVDPIKYYAYRAMGLPVLTTRFGEMVDLGSREKTFYMDDPADLPRIAATALSASTDPAAVAEFRQTHDWSRRFEQAGLFDRILRS